MLTVEKSLLRGVQVFLREKGEWRGSWGNTEMLVWRRRRIFVVGKGNNLVFWKMKKFLV